MHTHPLNLDPCEHGSGVSVSELTSVPTYVSALFIQMQEPCSPPLVATLRWAGQCLEGSDTHGPLLWWPGRS